MATSFPIHKIYDNTVKFSSNDEHTENEILQMLTKSGYQNKIWGINLTNRGKQVEVKFKQTKDSNNFIQTGIYDDTRHATYTVEPAFDKDRTIITVFNVPLGASGGSVQQYLEENYLKVLSHERQSIKYGDNRVYIGVIKFRCDKKEGFVNLPQWKTFYNNRKIGIRHAEQYEERDRLALAKQDLEENNRKRTEQRKIEEQNAERNRKNKELRKRIETEKKEQERIAKEKVEKDKQDKRDFGHLIYGRLDKVSPEMAEQIQKKKTSEAKYVRLSPKEFEDKKEGYIEEDIDLEIAKGEEILTTEHPLNRIDDTNVNMEEIQTITTDQATEIVKEMETEGTTQDNTIKDESEQIKEGEQEQEITKQSEEEMTKGGVAEKVEEMEKELKLKEKELETNVKVISDLYTQFDEKAEGMRNMLNVQETALDKMRLKGEEVE